MRRWKTIAGDNIMCFTRAEWADPALPDSSSFPAIPPVDKLGLTKVGRNGKAPMSRHAAARSCLEVLGRQTIQQHRKNAGEREQIIARRISSLRASHVTHGLRGNAKLCEAMALPPTLPVCPARSVCLIFCGAFVGGGTPCTARARTRAFLVRTSHPTHARHAHTHTHMHSQSR